MHEQKGAERRRRGDLAPVSVGPEAAGRRKNQWALRSNQRRPRKSKSGPGSCRSEPKPSAPQVLQRKLPIEGADGPRRELVGRHSPKKQWLTRAEPEAHLWIHDHNLPNILRLEKRHLHLQQWELIRSGKALLPRTVPCRQAGLHCNSLG